MCNYCVFNVYRILYLNMYDNLKESGLDPEQAIKDCAAEYKKREGFQRFYLSPYDANEVLQLLDELIISSGIGLDFFKALLTAIEHGGYYDLPESRQNWEMGKYKEHVEHHVAGWSFEHAAAGNKDRHKTVYRLMRIDK